MLKGRSIAAALAGMLALLALALPVRSAGPIETNIFAVQGVEVDVTSTDASAAKNQALMDVQVKAFFQLVERLGSTELAEELKAKLKPEDIAPYLRSLSIEQENSAPGRYIGKFTVRFLPEKTQKFFESYGIRVPTEQADPILVLPVYRGPEGGSLWEDNPWRKAWIDLKGEQGIVPIIVPLGDLEDTETLTAEDAIRGEAIRLEAIRKRYGAPSLLVAQAQPTEDGGLHVYIAGETKLGKLEFNKIYKPEAGSAEPVEPGAVQAFQQALYKFYKEQEEKLAAEEAARSANLSQSLAVSVPFTSPREWNAIRSRILTTPNVIGVDLSSLSADGAVIRLMFTHTVEELQDNMQRAGLNLAQSGSAWVIQPM
ncbi:DUF2066 domain-containing protein [Aestuariivirga sp.]|uniref:DUF2066 domain-containing protein n=1 Tax=Aestuariivirga sp. TaxID=2650926 RepID=UPI00391CC9AA